MKYEKSKENTDNKTINKWFTYAATKPQHIQYVDELTMTIWDIPEYEEGFIIPSKGDRIWLGDDLYTVDHKTYNPENGLLFISIKMFNKEK